MPTIIDTRSKAEFDQSHVVDAMCFDVERLAEGKMPELPKSEDIVVYCRTGNRSAAAKHFLTTYGFTNVKNGGSLTDMTNQDYNLVK